MAKARQTLERRQLGLALRRLRDAVGVTQQAASEVIGLSRHRITELEEGTGTVSVENLGKLLDLYKVSGEERRTTLALGAEARRRRRDRKAYVDRLPNGFERFADLESSASTIDLYDSAYVPGLLQAPGYMAAVLDDSEGVLWTTSREERIEFRRDRQSAILGGVDQYALRVVLPEDSLRVGFGRPGVVREQLAHLLALMADRPRLAIRVLGRQVERNPLRGCNLTLFGFDGRAPVIGYSESLMLGIAYYDDEGVTATLTRAFECVWGLAMSEAASESFIRNLMEEL
ncbi:Helix-turn-helix domain-containing protein [Lentzea fradiae]|uniref:Helix-turn-helix domain-containing protein n=1 Tax=Lentzea fradiae TaxID=200378 RepID=A0A1G7TNS9_9PSEU|nr:helix-turn-helix transcriptional regulator [Lentzea fradiae]SDG36976.1 Helix-turn-helix domain-containing protein [Lentzea fradiae]